MSTARVEPMPQEAYTAWRADRETAGRPLPAPEPGGDDLQAVEIHVGDVAVGGALIALGRRGGVPRASIRELQTTLPDDATEAWREVLAAIDDHLRSRGAQQVVTAVPARLGPVFREAGYLATMTGIVHHHGPERRMVDEGRVTLRPMDPDERRAFASDAAALLRAGMERAGVLAAPGAPMEPVDRRLQALVDDPPAREVLLTALADEVPVGRYWASLDDGLLVGHVFEILAEHRGQGLQRPFMAALETWMRERGVREGRGRIYGYDARFRASMAGIGVGVEELHLRKDL